MINKISKINEKWFYILADLFNKASIYLLMLVFSYIVSPDNYGSLSLFNSLVTLFFVFVSFNLTNSYITKKRLEDNCDFKKILSTVITFILFLNFLFLIFSILVLVLNITIYSIAPMILFCSIITAILTCNYELLQTIFVAEKKKIHYLLVSTIFSTMLIIFSFLLFFYKGSIGIYAIIYTKIILLFFFSLYAFLYLRKKFKIKFMVDKSILKESLKFSSPLILHSLSGFILNYLDKFMLNDIENLTSTAIYSFSYNLSSVLMVISIALNKSLIPKFFSLKNSNENEKINKLIINDLKLMCFIYFVYTIVLGYIFPIFPNVYNNSILLFIILTFNYLVFYGYNIYSNYLYYKGNTVTIFTNTLISGIINVVLNSILIPRYSSIGASISTIISFFILFLLYYFSIRKTEKDYFEIKIFFKYFTICGIFSILYFFSYQYFIFRLIWVLIMGVLLLKYMNKVLKRSNL